MRWIDNAAGWARAIQAWLQANEELVDLITVWSMVAACLMIAVGGFVLWWSMLGTKDQSAFGAALKALTLALGAYGIGKGALWTSSLWGYYTGDTYGFWERMALRTGVIVVAVAISISMSIMVWAYHKEDWGR